MPKLEPLVLVRNDSPESATVWATPGMVAANLVDLGQDRVGPLRRSRVRQLDIDEQITLILGGNETGRALAMRHQVSPSRPA